MEDNFFPIPEVGWGKWEGSGGNKNNAGSSVILIAKELNANAMAISTGGGEGTRGGMSGATLGHGGGGTGFCYIACERQASA